MNSRALLVSIVLVGCEDNAQVPPSVGGIEGHHAASGAPINGRGGDERAPSRGVSPPDFARSVEKFPAASQRVPAAPAMAAVAEEDDDGEEDPDGGDGGAGALAAAAASPEASAFVVPVGFVPTYRAAAFRHQELDNILLYTADGRALLNQDGEFLVEQAQIRPDLLAIGFSNVEATTIVLLPGGPGRLEAVDRVKRRLRADRSGENWQGFEAYVDEVLTAVQLHNRQVIARSKSVVEPAARKTLGHFYLASQEHILFEIRRVLRAERPLIPSDLEGLIGWANLVATQYNAVIEKDEHMP